PAKAAAAVADVATAAAAMTFVRRDAVFNRERRIVGHLYRLQHPGHDDPTQASTLSLQAIDGALLNTLCDGNAHWGAKTGFIPLSSRSLDDPLLLKLPSENTVLLLTLAEADSDPEALLARVNLLRGRGIRIGVFRQPRHPGFAPLLAVVDFGAIDVAEAQGSIVRDFSVALRSAKELHRTIDLFGANIETLDDVQLCHRCHFGYFHGPFALQHESWKPSKSSNPHKMHLMHLLNLVQSDAENREIAVQVKQDPILTFRILRYLNSPAIALVRTISSIDEALILLGRQKLMRWLSVLLFSVKNPDYADWLLVENALSRGRLMELLGDQGTGGLDNDDLFLTGILSNLDRILHIPLPEAIAQLKLPEDIPRALLQGQGPYAPLLLVAEACEGQDGERIGLAAQRCGLDPIEVNQAMLAATAWASDITSHWE
ncbi:MAG TPA: HDOD domain-containing protein, partial [Rhodocyclaceae bacterium]|nr:HDOD domain-containing protein [Rhodocyclaceae bacterium]